MFNLVHLHWSIFVMPHEIPWKWGGLFLVQVWIQSNYETYTRPLEYEIREGDMFSYTTYKMFLCEIVLYGLSYMRLVREIKNYAQL